MTGDFDSSELLSRLRNDDPSAWRDVMGRYSDRLVALANAKLNVQVRQKEDPDDVVQSVFRTFHRRVARTHQIESVRESLWPLLAAITVHKCHDRLAHYAAQKRDLHREMRAEGDSEDCRLSWDFVANHEPTELEALVLRETLEQLIRGSKETEREILLLRLQDHSVAEIAAKVNRTRRTVQLALKRLKQRLEEDFGELS